MIIPSSWTGYWTQVIGRCCVKMLQFRSLNVSNIACFEKVKNSNRPTVIVSNHISLFDGLILSSALGDICYFVNLDGMKLIPGISDVNKKIGSVFIDQQSGNSHKIKEYIDNRKNGENMLVVFPDSMQPVPSNKCIAPFKSGAFIHGYDILPIVIRYKNYNIDPKYLWYKGETALHSILKMLLDDSCEVEVVILEPIIPRKNENVDHLKNRVHNLMSQVYTNC